MARPRLMRRPHLSGPIVWMGVAVIVAAIVVQMTRTGIDVLALLVAGFVLLLIERTIGDWVADNLGPVPTILVFALMAGLGVAYVTTDSGRSRAGRFFGAADAQGYHSLYFSVDDGRRGRDQEGVTDAVSDALSRPLGARPAVATSGSAPPARAPDSPSASVAPVGHATRPDPGAGSVSPIPGQQASGVRIARLTLSPEVAIVGQVVVFRVEVTSDSPGTIPGVEFSVDGRDLATVTPSTEGIATVQWKTRVPGQYVVRARLVGGLFGGGSTSAAFSVLPGTR